MEQSYTNKDTFTDLLEILACPKCKGVLRLGENRNYLICDTCRLKYPVQEGIPVMLVDKAIPLE